MLLQQSTISAQYYKWTYNIDLRKLLFYYRTSTSAIEIVQIGLQYRQFVGKCWGILKKNTTMCVWGSRQCVHSWAYINKSITLRSRNLASSIDECLYVCVCIYIYIYINMNRERARDRTEIYIVIGSLLTEKYIIYAYIYIYIYIDVYEANLNNWVCTICTR